LVRCDVPLDVALERAAKRLKDPKRVSDATPETVRAQHATSEEFDERSEARLLRLDATRPLDQQVASIARAVDDLSTE
jgi:thymidylate kinase